jgi:hypothetical protein
MPTGGGVAVAQLLIGIVFLSLAGQLFSMRLRSSVNLCNYDVQQRCCFGKLAYFPGRSNRELSVPSGLYDIAQERI